MDTKEKEAQEFMTVAGAAKFLCVSEQKIRALRATERGFPYHKIGEKVLFHRDELRQWALAH